MPFLINSFLFFAGAAYLFVINAYFIFMASAVVLSLLKIPKVRKLSDLEWKVLRFRMIRNTLIVLVPAIAFAVVELIK